MTNRISTESIAIDCLNSTKYLIFRDTIGAMESATPQVRQELRSMAQEHTKLADDWFRLMENRGWYLVPQANPSLVNQVVNHVENISRQAQVGQAFSPYQQQNNQYF